MGPEFNRFVAWKSGASHAQTHTCAASIQYLQSPAHALALQASTPRTPKNTPAPSLHTPHARTTRELVLSISKGSSRLSSCTSCIRWYTSGTEWRREGERHLKVTLLEVPRQAPPSPPAPPLEAVTAGDPLGSWSCTCLPSRGYA